MLSLAGSLAAVGLAAFAVWMSLNLLRQQGRLLLRVEALEGQLGDVHLATTNAVPVPGAPDFSLPGLDGRTVGLSELKARGRPLLLVFTDPGCLACRDLLPDVGTWQRDYADRVTVVAISRGTVAANQVHADAAGLNMLLLQAGHEVETAYGVEASPSAVGVGPTGLIASPVVAGTEAIRGLMASVISALDLRARAVDGQGHGHGAETNAIQ